MSTRPPRISAHALLRYIERTMGIDVDRVRADILTAEVREALDAGATGITVNGVQMVVEDGVIVTVLAEGMRPKAKSKARWHDLDTEAKRRLRAEAAYREAAGH